MWFNKYYFKRIIYRTKNQSRIVIFACLIVAIMIFGLIAFSTLYKLKKQIVYNNVCKANIISRALFDLHYDKFDLKSLTSTISIRSNYKYDTNCLYILSQYYFYAFNLKHSQYDLKLIYKYQKDHPINSNLLAYQSLTTLQQNINISLLQSQESNNNSKLLNPIPPKP